MFFEKLKMLEIEKSSKFSERVLVLSIPAAVVFTVLALLKLLSPFSAVLSYMAIVFFNMIFLSSISVELKRLKKYINDLSLGKFDKNVSLSEDEAQDIADAVNSMHRFFTDKTDALEAKSMADMAVLDTLPDPIMMLDRSGNVLSANLAARKLLGHKITEHNIEKILNINTFTQAATKVLKGQSESENLAFFMPEPLNKKLFAHINKLPDFAHSRAFASVSLYDLTKTVTVEKMQSDFVANASHELKTPLSVISGFIDTLQTSAKDDEAAREQFLNIMAQQAAFMSDLIENLLSLSKIEMQQNELPKEKTDILKIADEVVGALALKAESKGMHIDLTCQPNLPKITADSGQIKQLVQNLTDNAIKYGLANSAVKIDIKTVLSMPSAKNEEGGDSKAVLISINNKGPKISQTDLARLTERFFRLQAHKDMGIKGTGLGLAIAKRIIMRHRGNLTVSSTTLNGTTFSVYLPIKL